MGELAAKFGFDELTNGAGGISKALVAEFIGNLLLNLFGCGACINVKNGLNAPADIVLIALAFGLTVFAVVSAIGHVSGGHINPAVTAGLVSVGRVKPIRGVLYVVAQCAGAAAGSGLLKAFTPERVAGKLGVTALGTDVTSLQGFGIEFFLGFVLIFVVCGVCDPHKHDAKATAPLAIGLTVTLGHLLAVDYTGSAMNPARSFGSALVANDWADHWVYWAGPAAGGVAAALLYVHVFSAPAVDSAQYRPVASDDKELKRLGGKSEA
ncbi:aquaporin AQPAe.a [Amyelois transitella]|uniref:aquaporin AQPAe.a n=1 Tax=Amyelois transitella TaxID=680683 RepID=UPI00067D2428|nr:aquaporin AQPAe.a [Amyelois transitella]XP_013195019.1 aquaporin AQPAe.a [Amyelois transitella]XP_013195020.1 aquaporin AQPAe.a [Amyelois transitella]XP_060810485.1 aquaporin AQPAe.a [Amyelois transitella]